jgi:hypothetical protein
MGLMAESQEGGTLGLSVDANEFGVQWAAATDLGKRLKLQ